MDWNYDGDIWFLQRNWSYPWRIHGRSHGLEMDLLDLLTFRDRGLLYDFENVP
ncbi:hypothetical protein D3C76_1692400 [compost metagenome]